MIDWRQCSDTYQVFILNVCILLLHVFGVILVTLSDVREWKNRIIYFSVVMCYLI